MSKLDVENGLKLRGFRKQNGYSQSYIGEIVGKDHRTISRYELGEVSIPLEVVKILNKKYNIKLDYVKKGQRRSYATKETYIKKSAITVKEEVIAKSLEDVINTLTKLVEYLRG